MLKPLAPIGANEATAARLLDMKTSEFRQLVRDGHLPPSRNIGGHERWDVEELRKIISGEAVEGLDNAQW